MRSYNRFAKGCCCSLALAAVLLCASQASAQLVVSQVYGDSNAAGPNGDYVEIFNRSCADVNLDAYSVQIATATGTAWSVVPLPNFVLVPGQYYLIKLTNTAAGTVILTPDLTASPAITTLTLTSGKVAIVLEDQPVSIIDTTVPTNACPASAQIIDFVRYANAAVAACTEGAPKNTTGAAAGTGIERGLGGCTDTNVNNNDFAVTAVGPVLRNSSATPAPCVGVDPNYGACNLSNGMCLVVTEAGCEFLVGTYLGDCSDCAPMGACCVAGGCSNTIQSACTGTWLAGTPCQVSTYSMTEIPVAFDDISATGTIVPGISAASADDGAAQVQLPFPVNFYGATKTGVSIGINGFVSFSGAATSFSNVAIPATGTPNDAIYAMWDDLIFRTGVQHVRTQTIGALGSRTFIIQWTDIPQIGPFGSNTFQIKLFENSDCIELHYSVADATELSTGETNGTTIGVENASGTAATQFAPPAGARAALANLIAANNALRFCPISSTCVSGACCTFPPAGCSETLQTVCAASGGVFLGAGTTCAESDCPGACCRPDGTCAVITETACTALGAGAVFRGDTTCPPSVACAEAGACCTPEGGCTQVVEAACIAPNTWSAGACPVVTYTANPDCEPNFLDISSTGTELLGWATFDDSALPITLPFEFNFYGTLHTAASVGINGWVALGGGSAAGIPADAPLSGAQAGNGIYVYGDDLHLRGTVPDPVGSVHTQQFGTSPDSVFIIQWTNVDIFTPSQPDGQRNTFQVKLYEASGVIEMQYLSLNLTGQSPPADIVIGVKQSPANFTEVSQSVVGVGPAAIIFAPNGLCNAASLATGSCCVPNQPCSEMTQAACQLACGVYQGDGTNCTTTPCVTEACCLPQGGCTDTLTLACTASGGTPQGPGSNCGTANCPPSGRCCTASGGCSLTTQANCQDSGSSWVQGEDCTTLPCALGACCAADGSCSQLTEAGCTAANGIRWTGATSCTPNLCQGRCCAPDGSCSITAFNACIEPATYGGDGSTCTGTPCQGSCCDSVSGVCTLTGPADCLGANQVFGGLGSTCATANCSGRCCQANGSCSVSGSAGCAGGTYAAGLDCSNHTEYGNPSPATVLIPTTGTGPGASVPSIINVPDNFPIVDVDVRVKIQHSFRGDLIVCLTGPGGSPTVRFSPGTDCAPTVITGGECGLEDNFNVIWDDEGAAINCLSANLSNLANNPDRVIPNQSLTAFDGLPSVGDWTLTVFDDQSGDSGTLLEWSLLLDAGVSPCPAVGCSCFGDMNADTLVSGADIAGFTACVTGGGGSCACADMDHDGGADSDDVDEFVTALLNGTCGAP